VARHKGLVLQPPPRNNFHFASNMLNAFATLYKRELLSVLQSVLGMAILGVFVLLSGLFHWVFPGNWNLLDRGVADLEPFFLFTPWVLMFLIPAITMRALAEERNAGTLEWLLTRPLDAAWILYAKFFAGLTLVGLALLPTLINAVLLNALGQPAGNLDAGAVLAGYLGLMLLSAAFIAIGLAASASTSSQVVSFLASFTLSLLWYYGPSALGSFDLFGSWDHAVQWMGLELHYLSACRGALALRDVAWFLTATGAGLAVARYRILTNR
jgi:ABC-2 type transport system permease protein